MTSVNCECANRRAAEAEAEIERLNGCLVDVTQKWNELLTSNGQVLLSNGALREELKQCRKDNASLIKSIDESLAREEAMRSIVKSQKDILAAAQEAVDTSAACVRDRERQFAELRQRIVENAEQARAERVGWAA